MSIADTSGGAEESGLAALAGKYLTFKLDAEEFGLEILKVQEIIKMMEITRVPRTPPFVRGVINLRGKVIPVVDLRLKFDMDSRDTTDKTCVIVVTVKKAAGAVVMGIIVDEVSEVLDVAGSSIEPPPEFGGTVDTSFILGMGKIGERVVTLMDVDRVLSGEEVAAVASAGPDA
ncbi:MAG: purine-binding chemotaxis protein CheW [Lentisphaerae bacterium]|nr:purine-binding chemotaxis protein CheW [Lentisphaerota bacterium]